MFKIVHETKEYFSEAEELVEDFLTRIFGAVDLVPEEASVEEVPHETGGDEAKSDPEEQTHEDS